MRNVRGFELIVIRRTLCHCEVVPTTVAIQEWRHTSIDSQTRTIFLSVIARRSSAVAIQTVFIVRPSESVDCVQGARGSELSSHVFMVEMW